MYNFTPGCDTTDNIDTCTVVSLQHQNSVNLKIARTLSCVGNYMLSIELTF